LLFEVVEDGKVGYDLTIVIVDYKVIEEAPKFKTLEQIVTVNDKFF